MAVPYPGREPVVEPDARASDLRALLGIPPSSNRTGFITGAAYGHH